LDNTSKQPELEQAAFYELLGEKREYSSVDFPYFPIQDLVKATTEVEHDTMMDLLKEYGERRHPYPMVRGEHE
jgi:hypothetical protein